MFGLLGELGARLRMYKQTGQVIGSGSKQVKIGENGTKDVLEFF